MKKLLLVLMCTAAIPAHALVTPPPGRDDPTMRIAAYNPMSRVALTLTTNRMTNITFSSQERIKRFALGMQGLENCPVGVPHKGKGENNEPFLNNMPLIGLKAGTTDLLVITLLPDGAERTYQFVLNVQPSEDANVVYGLTFTYPREVAAAAKEVAATTWKQKRDATARKVAEDRLATDIFYGQRNWRYVAQGRDAEIAPTEISDNTRLTAFRYPANMAQPTIYIVDPAGNELTAPTTVRDDMIIVQRTAPHFRLRLGPRVLDVWNKAYDPIGTNPGTGTTSPEVIRQVITQR